MSAYHFAIHNHGTKSETLGGMELSDDATAIAFGLGVILDLMHGGARHYGGWTMDITENARAVGSIPFKSK